MSAVLKISESSQIDSSRYAKCIEVSKRVRWDIDDDVIRGRAPDFSRKFLPDGLSFADRLPFLSATERRLLSQVQGRTYANMFGLVERFIGAKVIELNGAHRLGDQVAFEALVRFTDEELKHQELFRRIDSMIATGMPPGYAFLPQHNEVAAVVLSKSTWSVLALTYSIELMSQAHYKASIESETGLCSLFKDVFLFHWKEESQHAIVDELEWIREDNAISSTARNLAVDDLIDLVGAVDGILQMQSVADAEYFVNVCGRPLAAPEARALKGTLLDAYRWQYILSGVQIPRFQDRLTGMISASQHDRIACALTPIAMSAGSSST